MATKNRHKPEATQRAAAVAPWDAAASDPDLDVDELLADAPEAAAEAAQQPPPASNAPPAVKPAPPKLRKATATVELAPFRDNVHTPTHVEVRFEPAQARTMRRLYDGLDQAGVRLKNGRRVGSPADCIRYVLEQLDEGGS